MIAALLAIAAGASFTCASPAVHDGDSIRCAGQRQAVRLAGIDAPEMAGSPKCARRSRHGWCDFALAVTARDRLRGLVSRGTVRCVAIGDDRYGRLLADCAAGGRDLGEAMIAAGLARRWE